MKCRFCNNNLKHEFVDLGHHPPSNSFLDRSQLLKSELFFPLKLYVCEKCWLVQIDEYKEAREIFSDDYKYFSSFSKTWLKHCEEYARMMISRFGYSNNSQIIEVASNDGYLLQYFKERHIPVLGIEPSAGTARIAIQKGINTRIQYLETKFARRLVTEGTKADLLIANNVLAHVPNLNDFVNSCKILLAPNGLITLEFPHLVNLVLNTQFDTIYHEHFSYFSFTTVRKLFKKHDLDIFDVEEIPTHAGSLRIYAKHSKNKNYEVSSQVKKMIEREKEQGVTSLKFYNGFQSKTDRIKNDFIFFLLRQKLKGFSIAGYGAAAKGNTFLNYCGIRKDLIDFVVDASPHKQNKYLPGTHIPVVDETFLRRKRPDFVLILPWNLQTEIVNQLSYIKSWGAKFVIAIPKLKVF